METGGRGNNSGRDLALPLDHNTAGQILRRTTATFISLLPTFLLLSFLLFFFHSFVENGSLFLASFIDRDPSLRSLLSKLDAAGSNLQGSSGASSRAGAGQPFSAVRHRRRQPFLHLTRVGTLDDDFFSGDDDDHRSIFGNYRKAQVNGSFLALSDFNSRFGFPNFVVDNGIKYQEVVKTGIAFKLNSRYKGGVEIDEEGNATVVGFGEEKVKVEEDRIVDFTVFVAGLELGRRDAAALFFLISFLATAYGWVILGFVIAYSCVMGVVFVSVVNDLLQRPDSLVWGVWSGSKFGLKRLSGFILMSWAVRDALAQILGLWFFGEIEDQYSFLKLFLRLKLMPFSISTPWVGGYEKEISGFLSAWFFMDTMVSFLFAVDTWVTVANARSSGRQIVKEGWNLLAMMLHPAVLLKCLEVILCGSFLRWGLTQICGRSFALILQSLFRVYFMVAWLIFYLVARNRDANLKGGTFGRREVEGLIEGLR